MIAYERKAAERISASKAALGLARDEIERIKDDEPAILAQILTQVALSEALIAVAYALLGPQR